MKIFANTKFRIITAVLLCIAAGVLFGRVSSDAVSPVTRFVSVCFAPLEKLSSAIVSGLKDFSLSFRSADYYRAQNEEFSERILELEKQVADYEDVRQQLDSYRLAYGVLGEHPEYRTVYASVVARDASDLYRGFTLDKGSVDGISAGNPVIYGDANLAGIVTEVSETSCVVSAVTDPGISIGVYEVRSREDGYLRNNVECAFMGLAKFAGLTSGTAVNEGGIVCTSGAGGTCPRDLVVGTVKTVAASETDVSAYATVAPSVDTSSVRNVFVITDFS